MPCAWSGKDFEGTARRCKEACQAAGGTQAALSLHSMWGGCSSGGVPTCSLPRCGSSAGSAACQAQCSSRLAASAASRSRCRSAVSWATHGRHCECTHLALWHSHRPRRRDDAPACGCSDLGAPQIQPSEYFLMIMILLITTTILIITVNNDNNNNNYNDNNNIRKN